MLGERLGRVEERIRCAADRAGRKREDIALIAVTKKFPAEVMHEAYDLGLRVFGENYVQEFEAKHPALTDLSGAEFHLIGHLQSNKARTAVDLFQVIQTVDSEKLARRLDAMNKPLEIMIEVKISEEASKFGAAPEDLPKLIDAIRACPEFAAYRPNDDASLERRSGSYAPLFPPLGRSCPRAGFGEALDGHVARPRSRHRRGRDAYSRGNSLVRPETETSRQYTMKLKAS